MEEINLKEIQKNQPIINIGTLGHVSHGKSTIVRSLSGKRPQQFSAEQIRNITIQLGYANVKIWKCECEAPSCYQPTSWKVREKKCKQCKTDMELELHFSFVDSPGHQSYMSTMLSGTAVMDSALIVIAGNEQIPQPQTKEHIIAAELSELTNSVVCLNKCDLMPYTDVIKSYQKGKEFLEGTSFENSEIIPVCANFGVNMDLLCQKICENIKVPERDLVSSPRMIVIRSFDVNKGGDPIKDMKGGIGGGSILRGILRVGDRIEIRPGLIYTAENEEGVEEFVYKPLFTTITSLYSEQQALEMAIPGGLIGVGTLLDPCFTRSNNLVGQILGNDLPEVYIELKVKFQLIREFMGKGKKTFTKGEKILVSIHSSEIEAKVMKVMKGKSIIIELTQPVCVEINEKLSISKSVNNRWRLSGFGVIEKGKPIKKL